MSGPSGIPSLVFEGDEAVVAELSPLRCELEAQLASGFPSSLALGVLDRTGLKLRAHGGLACSVGACVPATERTRYDLASLTKVVCTVTLVALALERGALALEDPVATWLPGFSGKTTTVWHPVTHTSGIVPHVGFYETCSGRTAIQAAVLAAAAAGVPGETVAYSDLNFMLLGWILERCLGRDLDELFQREVAEPLGMHRAVFRPGPDGRDEIAATELDGDQRLAPGLVWGEVHDGNAFALGGVAGHAGLFATLDDLAAFAHALLCPADAGLLTPASVALLSSTQATTGDDVRGIGWRLEPAAWGSWPAGTMWHTGFTGTSLLVSPVIGVSVILLTNAIHPRRQLEEQAELRVRVHRQLAEALA